MAHLRRETLWRTLFFTSLLVGIACGCAHRGDMSKAALEAMYPSWVRYGTGLIAENNERALIAVGHVVGMRNVALARSTADNRARAELVELLERFLATLIADFEATKSQTASSQLDEELTREQAVKVLTAASLGGVSIVQHGFFGADNSVFAAARLELDHIIDGSVRIRELSAQLRDWLSHNAQQSFDRMLIEQNSARPVAQGKS